MTQKLTYMMTFFAALVALEVTACAISEEESGHDADESTDNGIGDARDVDDDTTDATETDADADDCVPVSGYPVETDGSGDRCADLTGTAEVVGCVPADRSWPEILTCIENIESGEQRATLNEYAQLLDQEWRRCDEGAPPCSR